MKKQIVSLAIALIFFLSVPYLFSSIGVHVIAATTKSQATSAHITPTPMPAPTPVEYALPYPGMLPDHPLYFLKNLRDRIIELLITDPINKAEFYLLQADKKLNMSIILTDMGKTSAAQDTLAQSFASRAKAVALIQSLAHSGKNVPPFVLEKLSLSILKHKEVLMKLRLDVNAITSLLDASYKLLTPAK